MDYTNFKGSKDFRPNNPSGLGKQSTRWWKADPKDVAGSMVSTGKALYEAQSARRLMNLVHARLYGNFEMSGLGPGTYSSQNSALPFVTGSSTSRVTFNVIAACVETLAAKIAKNRPIPRFMTDGAGGWAMQQKARQMTQFNKGLYYETNVYEHMKRLRFDDYIYGTGALHVFMNDKNRIECERTLIDELLVDDADGVYGKPKQLLWRRFADKDALLAVYGDTKERVDAIENAKMDPEEMQFDSTSDTVVFWEGWRLPSKPGAKDGRYVVAIDGVCLHEEVWKLDRFPFVFSRYVERTLGFWGQGIAEKLTGIQIELNYLTRSISQQVRRRGKGRYFAPYNSINPNHMDNSLVPVVLYKGAVPPTPDNSNSIASEELMHMDRLYSRGFQEIGLSELSAQSKKPSGLDAAVAIREFDEKETERFALAAQAHETSFMDFTELAFDLIRVYGGSGYKVKLPNKRYMIELNWDDINLERDAYVMQMFPVSSLPSTPGARLQRVLELKDAKLIDDPTAKALLDYPDIESEMNLGNAARDDVDASISMILDNPKPEMPQLDPYQNLELIMTRGIEAYLFAKNHGAEEKRLAMLRELIDNASSTMQAQIQAQTAQAMPAPGAAPAVGPASPDVNVNVEASPPAPVAPPVVG